MSKKKLHYWHTPDNMQTFGRKFSLRGRPQRHHLNQEKTELLYILSFRLLLALQHPQAGGSIKKLSGAVQSECGALRQQCRCRHTTIMLTCEVNFKRSHPRRSADRMRSASRKKMRMREFKHSARVGAIRRCEMLSLSLSLSVCVCVCVYRVTETVSHHRIINTRINTWQSDRFFSSNYNVKQELQCNHVVFYILRWPDLWRQFIVREAKNCDMRHRPNHKWCQRYCFHHLAFVSCEFHSKTHLFDGNSCKKVISIFYLFTGFQLCFYHTYT